MSDDTEVKSTQETNKIKQKKNKWLIPIIIGVTIIIATVGTIAIVSIAVPKSENRTQMRQGKKYLSDMDYQKAVLAYEEAISIEPENEEAYKKLADAYDGLIAQCILDNDIPQALGYIENVEKGLEEGLALISSEKLQERLDGYIELAGILEKNLDNKD